MSGRCGCRLVRRQGASRPEVGCTGSSRKILISRPFRQPRPARSRISCSSIPTAIVCAPRRTRCASCQALKSPPRSGLPGPGSSLPTHPTSWSRISGFRRTTACIWCTWRRDARGASCTRLTTISCWLARCRRLARFTNARRLPHARRMRRPHPSASRSTKPHGSRSEEGPNPPRRRRQSLVRSRTGPVEQPGATNAGPSLRAVIRVRKKGAVSRGKRLRGREMTCTWPRWSMVQPPEQLCLLIPVSLARGSTSVPS